MILTVKPLVLGRWFLASALLASSASATASDHGPALRQEADGRHALVWEATTGHPVRIDGLRLTLPDARAARDRPLKLALGSQTVQACAATWEYAVTLDDRQHPVSGSARLDVNVSDKAGEDAVLCRSTLNFKEPVGVDVTVQYTYELLGPPPTTVSLPERSGHVTTRPLQPNAAASGKFELGAGAASGGGHDLGMPVLDVCWERPEHELQPLRLAIATDPHCGCSISGVVRPEGATPVTRVTVSTTYQGSIVPIIGEKRSLSLEFHRRGMDGSLRSFYRTIPEIKPGPQWTQGIHLVYYDYLSEKGEGWFKDLQVLAERIPAKHRGHVAVCLHGWYDYFQQYAYDHQQKKLLKQWTAFPGTYKVPMSVESMHQAAPVCQATWASALCCISPMAPTVMPWRRTFTRSTC